MIRELIKQRIEDLDLKQIDVCKGTNIPPTTLSLYLNGKTHLPIGRIVKLMDVLGLTVGKEGELVGQYAPQEMLVPIKQRMSERGMIQAELARQCGVSRGTACTFLSKGVIGESTLERVLNLLNLTVVSYDKPKLSA